MFVFDTRHDPLHLQAFPPMFRYEEADAHFDEVERFYRSQPRNAPAALLADARAVLLVDAMTRRRVADAFTRLAPIMEQRAIAHAIVLSTSVVRHALTAIFWLKQPPWTIRTFTNMEDADAWIRERFVACGRPVPRAPPDWWAKGVEAKWQK